MVYILTRKTHWSLRASPVHPESCGCDGVTAARMRQTPKCTVRYGDRPMSLDSCSSDRIPVAKSRLSNKNQGNLLHIFKKGDGGMSGKQNDEAPKTPEETLAESVDAVVQQNLRLIELAGVRGFNPVVALDYTANGAGLLIRRLFEAVGAFEEGTIPWRTTMGDLFRTTGSLIETLLGLKKAPVMELEAVAVAFRQCMILWSDTHSPPVMTRKTYLKKIFDGEADFCGKLKELHKAYLRIELSRGGRKRALSAADVMDDEARNAAGERARVLNEIERLSGICGSVTKAVKTMRGGTYSARMKGVSDATWRKYYYDWQSAKRRRQLLKESQSMLNAAGDRINDRIKGNSDRINGGNDRINGTGDRINDRINCNDDRIKSLIAENPGISAMRIVEMSDKSESTIRRTLALLKKQGIVVYHGSKKTGGYYAIVKSNVERNREEAVSEHSATVCGIIQGMNREEHIAPIAAAIDSDGVMVCADAAQDAAVRASCIPPPAISKAA